jgi:SnoaL-like domain
MTVLGALSLVACGSKPAPPPRPAPTGDPFAGESADDVAVLRRELEAEVLESYERDEAAGGDDWQGVLDPALGVVRFGVRPGDESVTTRGAPPARALPLGLHPGADDADNPACPDNLRSKRLELHLSADGATAWIDDELAACVSVCGKRALLPLRLSAVYVRGGDRWVLAVEHLSYPQPAAALIAHGETSARPVDAMVSARAVSGELRETIATAAIATEPADRAAVFATDPDALAWWPDPAHELRDGAITSGPSLTAAFDAVSITTEGARVGIGPSGGTGAIAWWAGTLQVRARRAAAGSAAAEVPLRLRATFVLRRDPDRWRVVQSHVSAPIDDDALAREVAAGATMVGGRLHLACDGEAAAGPRTAGDGATAPAPAPRPDRGGRVAPAAPPPPAAGSR